MKKSKLITRKIVVSSTITAMAFSLSSCSSDDDNNWVRNKYSTITDCQKDYNAKDCEYISNFYYGPSYHYSSSSRSLDSGRTSLRSSDGVSSTASHIVNSTGAAIAIGAAAYSIKSGAFSKFARSGFGSTAHFSSVSS